MNGDQKKGERVQRNVDKYKTFNSDCPAGEHGEQEGEGSDVGRHEEQGPPRPLRWQGHRQELDYYSPSK